MPGKKGQSVHRVSVLDTVHQALREHPGDVSVISVPFGCVKGAATEAIDIRIKQLVIVSERVSLAGYASKLAQPVQSHLKTF